MDGRDSTSIPIGGSNPPSSVLLTGGFHEERLGLHVRVCVDHRNGSSRMGDDDQVSTQLG